MKTRIIIFVEIALLILVVCISSLVFDFESLGNRLLATMFNRPLCKDCNVVLVSLDTLSANRLPCYGGSHNTAPNLCKFAGENILFSNMYANSWYTLPSHVSIFTGLLSSSHGVSSSSSTLNKSIPFLPTLLQNAGYKTYFYMENHPNLPTDKVYYRGINKVNFIVRINEWETGIEQLLSDKTKKSFFFFHIWDLSFPYAKSSSIKRAMSENDKEMFEPGFGFVPNYEFTKDFYLYVTKSIQSDVAYGYFDKEIQTNPQLVNIFTSSSYESLKDKYYQEEEIHNMISSYWYKYYFKIYEEKYASNSANNKLLASKYDEKIFELDQERALLDLIKVVKGKKDTILIITSDHGEEFMEHGALTHASLYDQNTKIPLIMYIPGIEKQNIKQIAQSIDIAPTILDLVGIPFESKMFQGESLMSYILGKSKFSKKYIFTEKRGDGLPLTIRDLNYKLFLIRPPNLKYVPYELYNTSTDPGEKRNIIYSEPDVVSLLEKQVKKMYQ